MPPWPVDTTSAVTDFQEMPHRDNVGRTNDRSQEPHSFHDSCSFILGRPKLTIAKNLSGIIKTARPKLTQEVEPFASVCGEYRGAKQSRADECVLPMALTEHCYGEGNDDRQNE